MIWIVRHAATEWSENGRHTGLTDLELNERGREAAHRLAPLLSRHEFDLVLTSPLSRARETCELAGFEGERCDDLVEWDYGEYEGLTTPQIRESRPTWNLWRDGCPGGERAEDVGARVDRVIERAAGAEQALCFAHGHVLRVLTARWLALDASAGALLALAPGGIGQLGYERETRVLRGWVPPEFAA